MKFLGSLLAVAFCLSLGAGCTGYRVQAKGATEGNAWVSHGGTTVWHCSATTGRVKCKKVLD